MINIDLAGRNGLILGVANKRSLAWSIAERLDAAGSTEGPLANPLGVVTTNGLAVTIGGRS